MVEKEFGNDGNPASEDLSKAELIIRCMKSLPHPYTVTDVARTLAGSKSGRFLRRGLANVDEYGVGNDMPRTAWATYIKQMIMLGLIERDVDNKTKISLTGKADALMAGDYTIRFGADPLLTQRSSSPGQAVPPQANSAKGYKPDQDLNTAVSASSAGEIEDLFDQAMKLQLHLEYLADEYELAAGEYRQIVDTLVRQGFLSTGRYKLEKRLPDGDQKAEYRVIYD